MKTKISLSDFSFSFSGYGHYRVTYTSPVTHKKWTKMQLETSWLKIRRRDLNSISVVMQPSWWNVNVEDRKFDFIDNNIFFISVSPICVRYQVLTQTFLLHWVANGKHADTGFLLVISSFRTTAATAKDMTVCTGLAGEVFEWCEQGRVFSGDPCARQYEF